MAERMAVSVNLPDDMLDAVKRRARDLQFGNLSCYVRWLVAKDALPDSEDANLDVALIKEGLESGPGRVADEAFFQELNEETNRIIERNVAVAANSSRAAG